MKSPAKRQGLSIEIRSIELSDFNVCTSFFQLSSDVFGSSLVNTFFYRLRSTVNQVLRFFQTQTSQVFYYFHYVQLASASAFQDNVERSLFFCSSSSATTVSST